MWCLVIVGALSTGQVDRMQLPHADPEVIYRMEPIPPHVGPGEDYSTLGKRLAIEDRPLIAGWVEQERGAAPVPLASPQAPLYPRAVQWTIPPAQAPLGASGVVYGASGAVCGPAGCSPGTYRPRPGVFARMFGR